MERAAALARGAPKEEISVDAFSEEGERLHLQQRSGKGLVVLFSCLANELQ